MDPDFRNTLITEDYENTIDGKCEQRIFKQNRNKTDTII